MPQAMSLFFFFFQAEDGILARTVTGVQTCALPISSNAPPSEGAKWSDVARGHLTLDIRRGAPIGILITRGRLDNRAVHDEQPIIDRESFDRARKKRIDIPFANANIVDEQTSGRACSIGAREIDEARILIECRRRDVWEKRQGVAHRLTDPHWRAATARQQVEPIQCALKKHAFTGENDGLAVDAPNIARQSCWRSEGAGARVVRAVAGDRPDG